MEKNDIVLYICIFLILAVSITYLIFVIVHAYKTRRVCTSYAPVNAENEK